MNLAKPPTVTFYLRLLYGGGAERVLLNLIQEFVRQGIKVDLVLNVVGGPYLSQLPPEVRVVDLKEPRLLPGLFPLVRYLQKERPAVLISALHYTNEIAIWAKRLAGVPTRVVVSEHNTLSVHARERSTDRWSPRLAKLFYPMADTIVAVSQGVAKDLRQVTGLPADRIQVIYNPVISPEILRKAKETVEHPWFASGQPPVILGVGRLEPQKDFATLIRAFAQVQRIRPARLMILGNGQERSRLKSLIGELGLQETVKLQGFVSNPYAYMARSAALVVSSQWEGLPTVLIEAMAVGTPVVSTDCDSGPNEILDNGQYGWLVPVGDTDAIAEAILQTLTGNAKRANSSWLNQFTFEAAAQKYLETLRIKVAMSKSIS
jgi:glycosyltransferase involved in cell wall biosynthesis